MPDAESSSARSPDVERRPLGHRTPSIKSQAQVSGAGCQTSNIVVEIPVHWGRASMVDAERRLLANALLDPCNERFVLLSESCIPLFNFTTVYSYLLGSPFSFISSFDDPRKVGRGRYRPQMAPVVTLRDWRKGSQWFEARRQVAAVVVSDRAIYPVFREHCRPPCYMDEHYIPTLVTKLLPWMNANRSLTWVDWSKGGSHPATVRGRHVSTHFVEGLRRRRGCSYGGGSTSICFLFARKFDGSTLGPLLRMATAILGF
ncbi:hypothetical protein Taro_023632 [Colocasia esculenta]|uniref:Core-2/I-branching beta-1,6-N-acetylglucosaminyltransferase family protein n=1 Tax=Colocasia esculenta TaxID=4460 RepID=A0A843V4A2_COLES|nr:hypothetical protein [Colocasia esculenta]